MNSRGEKRGVKRDRSVSSRSDRSVSSRSDRSVSSGSYRSVSSSASSSTLTPPKAKKIKDQPRVREPHVQEHSGSSELHRKVFKKCGHKRPVFSTESTVFSTESTMLSLKSKSCEMCSTGRSKRSESWDSEMILGSFESIESSATQVSALLDQKKITSEEAMRAMEKFDDSYCLRILWLKMSLEHQIKYVKGLIRKNKKKSMSKAPSRYS